MITSIEIEGLRGIKQAKIEGLAPLTLIVGPNGCGKSSVLESVGVLCAGLHGPTTFGALASREWLGVAGMSFWFKEGANIKGTLAPAVDWTYGATTRPVTSVRMTLAVREAELRMTMAVPSPFGEATGQTAIVVDQDGSFSVRDRHQHHALLPFALQTHFVDLPVGLRARLNRRLSSALRDALSAIKLSPWYDTWIEYLRELRPRILSIESLALDERDEPFVFEGPPREGFPLAYAGDGFRRSLLVAATLASAKGGVAAIDEPEAFGHPTMFAAHAKMARRAIEDGTQVFMATHSLEFVTVALQAFEDDPEKVAVVGLRRDGGVLDPVTIAGPDAARRVLELGHDLRL